MIKIDQDLSDSIEVNSGQILEVPNKDRDGLEHEWLP